MAIVAQHATPNTATYQWWGKEVTVDLKECHEAFTRTAIKLGAGGNPATLFARKVGLNPETIHRFLRGETIRPQTLGLILTGLNLTAEQILK